VSDGLKGSYDVAVGQRAVYIRVNGLGSMNNCLCVRDFLDDMGAQGRSFVVVDLKYCTGMDSTFMGVLAGAATDEREGRRMAVAVVNADPHLVKLLRSVGLTEIIYVDPEPFEAPDLEFHHLEETATEKERLACIRTAHEHLMKISADNERIFGPLVRLIEKEMRARGFLDTDPAAR